VRLDRYDAIVIGGGPAGGAAALMLARAGWSVAIIEKAEFPRRKVCGEFISATNGPLLRELGIADDFLAACGPEVRRVGVFAKDGVVTAPMPRGPRHGFGHALGRERLDTLLLAAAARAGATVWQPWRVTMIERRDDGFACTIAGDDGSRELQSPIVIAASGSWERGPSQLQIEREHAASDLLAFKAHFRGCDLAADLMPLIAFPGGYGGMVHSDDDRVTLSCCIRRDVLQACRESERELGAADAVLAHIERHCGGARHALRGAKRDGAWLAAGPIRPGRRAVYADGIFRAGNLAGEAHPVIAEGISMALQSARLLCRRLIAAGRNGAAIGVARAYRADWDASFALRLHAAAAFAALAARPAVVSTLMPALKLFPGAITLGARLAGKSKLAVAAAG
jgi:flavin-dependent dehydrogenase